MKIPFHLAIIIDGNRRWAKEKNIPSFLGHKKGMDNVEKIGDYALKKGIKILTIFAFSTENWKRNKKEIEYLMKLLDKALSDIKKYNEKGIKVKIIGEKEKLSKKIQEKIEKLETETNNNKKGILNLAISYGARAEITSAFKKIQEKNIKKITEEIISNNLWTSSFPDPDLIIRTGGEYRLSNFLLWQSAYSELYFTKKYWPDFTEDDLDKALIEYSNRSRRFGK